MALRNWVEEYETVENEGTTVLGGSQPTVPPGLSASEEDSGEVGRTYVTISHAANEKAHLPKVEKISAP